MPPNRQAVASVIRSLSFAAEDLDVDLSGFVTESKYAPLTVDVDGPLSSSTSSQAKREQREQRQRRKGGGEIELPSDKAVVPTAPQHVRAAAQEEGQHERTDQEKSNGSYWAWPSLSERRDDKAAATGAEVEKTGELDDDELARRRAIVAQILAEDAASAASIEANLKREAAARVVSALAVFSNAKASAEKDTEGYWDWEDAENDTAAANDDAKDDEVASSSPLSVAHIEENLEKGSVRIKVHSHSPQTQGWPSPCDGYWEWNTLTPDEERRRKIDAILEDERARSLLTSSHVEANLEKLSLSAGDVHRPGSSADSDEYWSSSSSPRSTASTIIKALHTDDPTHPNHSYWDWTPPTTSEEERQGVLEKVLAEDEARRALSAASMEEMLRREAEEHAAMEQERWNGGDVGMDMGCMMMDAGGGGGYEYWDM